MIRADYRLRLPGPTAVPERVRRAIAEPVVNHRGPEFRAVMARVQELIQPLFGATNRVLIYAGSGTGMMEASLVNVLSPGDRVLVCVQGQFGERFSTIAAAMGAHVETIEVPWGTTIDPQAVEARLATVDYRAVVAVHNESSTAVTTNLAALGWLLRGRSTLLVADSVSGLGGLEMRQDEWGVDIVVSASQKCLMCPPGLGLASLSDKAWEAVNRGPGLPRFYWDFRKARASVEKSETPFTAPVALIGGLCEALEMIHEEGIADVLARHRRLSAALREGCAKLGLSSFGQRDALSPTVVALNVPEGMDGAAIVRAMYERHGSVIAGSRNKLQGKVIRIGVMGNCQESDIATDLRHLELTLREAMEEKRNAR
jgi:aspartate aminotransferase-like enzyme